MSAEPLVDIAIVSYQSREHVVRCLASLERESKCIPLTVTVVDNGSRDGTPAALAARFPWANVIESRENLGFARATNLAARKGHAEFVLALNPDTELTPGALSTLLRVFEQHADVAVVGPRLLREDGTFDHASRRSFPTIVGALGHFSGIGRRRRGGRLAQYRAPDVEEGGVDAVNGAFMLMRRAAFEACGGFDEGYWMYMEDLDLCYRLAQAGWTTWYEPLATVLHTKGASAGRVRSVRLELAFHHGMARFYRLHYAPHRATPVNVAVYVGIAARLAARIFLGPLRRLTLTRMSGFPS